MLNQFGLIRLRYPSQASLCRCNNRYQRGSMLKPPEKPFFHGICAAGCLPLQIWTGLSAATAPPALRQERVVFSV